jgi:sugar/nucleoside kinase (ribokinase family)
MQVVSLGDLALDVIVRLRQPLALGADAASEITLSTGGQGANVAAWLAALGGRARWLGVRADDDAGRIAASRLERLGVELVGPVVDGRTGVIVSLVDADGQRSMCPDRGSAVGLRAADLEDAWLSCDHLHLSGYALFEEPSRGAALRAAALARANGARVSVDLSSWSGIRDAGPESFRALLARLAPDVVLANEDEEATLAGRRLDREARARRLLVRRRRAPGPAGGGGRHHGRGRCPRRRLDPRRPRPRARSGRALRRSPGLDALSDALP